jgi:hypothetical protein
MCSVCYPLQFVLQSIIYANLVPINILLIIAGLVLFSLVITSMSCLFFCRALPNYFFVKEWKPKNWNIVREKLDKYVKEVYEECPPICFAACWG